MKKIALVGCLVVALAVVLGSMAGCGHKPQEKNTVTVWHWMTDRDPAFKALAAQYEAQTGIKVQFNVYPPSDAYSRKVVASAQAKVLPDIYGILGKKEIFASFVQSGYVADLTAEFQKDNQQWEKGFFPKALDVNRFEEGNSYDVVPGIYGVPIDVANIQMLYNKKLLAKAGIKQPPKTFDEWLAVNKALARVGVSGLVSGFGEAWMAECFASNYAFNIMGPDKIFATYRGEVPYTDPDWMTVFNVFQTLAKEGMFVPGIVTKGNKYAEQDFALERAAFAFNGSWCVNVYHDMNPKLEYGVMLPPAISTKFPLRIWGYAGSSFVVNNQSVRKDAAIAFLKWLTAAEQQAFLAKETKNLPANRRAVAAIPDILSSFAQEMDQTTHPTIWPLDENPIVLETFNKGLQSIMIGEKTPGQIAREVQDVKEREMARQKRK